MVLLSLLLIIFCCIIIWKTSDSFLISSEYLGRNLNDGVRGATINAIGSSLPELFTTFFFLFILKDKDGFASGIGTTAGSAIFNGMIIPALVILIVVIKRINNHITVSRKVLLRDGISLLICEFILIFILGGKTLTWGHGVLLMALYFIYVIFMLYTMKRKVPNKSFKSKHKQASGRIDTENNPTGKRLLIKVLTLNLKPLFIKKKINKSNARNLLLASMLVMATACLLLVKSCEWLGYSLGVPIYFIAAILASASTSLPDTILSIKDAQNGNYDDAVSNALGSNIFDVCFALGLPLFLFTLIYGPIEMQPETVINVAELRILLFILTFIAFIIYIAKTKMGGLSAFLLLLIYVTFTLYIFGRSVNNGYSNEISIALSEINNFIDSFRFWSK